jgi:hypothetical protein|tara:strand:+ start:2907 stop:3500 length:594 start_codon:yes stop_codon:yes gene_type:complete
MGMTQADMAGAPPPAQMEGAPPAQMEGATTDDAMDAMEQERMAQMEAVAATAPQPESPFSTALITKMVDEMNGFLSIVDPNIAEIDFDATDAKMNTPLPPEVFVPFVLIMSFVSQFENPDYEKFLMNPSEFVNDAAIRKATGIIKMMQQNNELVEDLKQTTEGEEPMDDEPAPEDMPPAEPMPGEMDEDDEALMGTM